MIIVFSMKKAAGGYPAVFRAHGVLDARRLLAFLRLFADRFARLVRALAAAAATPAPANASNLLARCASKASDQKSGRPRR